MKTTNDLTKGSPVKHILKFALPTLVGLLFQQLYNMADTMIVGKWLGVDALAAVGSVGSLNFMVIGFCIGVCAGFSIPVSQQFGAGDYHKLRKFVANSVWVSVVLSAVMTALVCIFCREILVVMKTPENIIDGAYSYIFIIFLGIPVTYLYNLLSGIIRALGDSQTPVYFLLISSVINVVLDIVSIKVFNMGTAGPAVATVISQAVSGILCLIFMVKNYSVLHITKSEWKPDKECIYGLFKNGIPMGLQYSITAIGSVVLQSSVNSISSAAVAAVTAGSKINMFFCCPFDALGSTMATYAGQNIGARKPQRISKGIRSAIMIGSVYAVAACVFLVFFGKTLALLFMDSDETAILEMAKKFITVSSMFYIPIAILNTTRFTVQGMGYSSLAVLAGVCEMVARCIMGFVLVPKFGFVCVCFASPLAWVAADLFLVPTLFICIKTKKKQLTPSAA